MVRVPPIVLLKGTATKLVVALAPVLLIVTLEGLFVEGHSRPAV